MDKKKNSIKFKFIYPESIDMRHAFKNTLVSLIVASFIFTPGAFAKPTGPRVKDLNRVLKIIKKSKEGIEVSKFVEANKPILKRKVYKRIIKDALPFWDRKISKIDLGKNHVKVSYKGKTLFMKYVDRGPMAFIVNNKPFLWKDMLTYKRTKARLEEIINGKSSKKISVLDKFFGKLSYFAAAATDPATTDTAARNKREECENERGREYISGATLKSIKNSKSGSISINEGEEATINFLNDGSNSKTLEKFKKFLRGFESLTSGRCGLCLGGYSIISPPSNGDENPPLLRLLKNDEGTCVSLEEPVFGHTEGEKPPDKKTNWIPLIIVGAAALLLFLLVKSKKKKKDGDKDDPNPAPPVVGWTPEGKCPTPGARGLTPIDIPPECRSSRCASTDESCSGTSSDSIE